MGPTRKREPEHIAICASVHAIVDSLTRPQAALLLRVATALGSATARVARSSASDIFSDELCAALGNELLLYHSTHDEKVNKKSFEYLLLYACRAAGVIASQNPNPTDPSADLVIGGARYSLKTQADSSIRDSALYIQKLMEARWIRDFDDPIDLGREARRRIPEHVRRCGRILVMRAFDAESAFRYEILEIPHDTLLLIEKLGENAFSAKNKFGSSGADVVDERGRAFRVLLDGSVEKVRIFNLQTSRCVKHGEWVIPRQMKSERTTDRDTRSGASPSA